MDQHEENNTFQHSVRPEFDANNIVPVLGEMLYIHLGHTFFFAQPNI